MQRQGRGACIIDTGIVARPRKHCRGPTGARHGLCSCEVLQHNLKEVGQEGFKVGNEAASVRELIMGAACEADVSGRLYKRALEVANEGLATG